MTTCSQRLGKVIRADNATNHMDADCWTVGIVNLFESNPVTIFPEHANWLKNAGL